MDGRTEHSQKINQKTKTKIINMPDIVKKYYYSISASTEPHTRKEYIQRIKAFLIFTNKEISKISDDDVACYFDYINENAINKRGRELSSSYQQQIWSALNGFFEYACKKEIIEKNPMLLYAYPKSKNRHKRVFLKPNEMNSMLKAVENISEKKGKRDIWKEKFKERDKLILYVLMNTGMRSEMLCEINISDFDFNNMRLRVVAKGGKTIEYAITETMKDYIDEWRIKRTNFLKYKTDALFINRFGDRLNYQGLRKIIKNYSKEIGKEITPHKLRASFITNFYEASNHDLEATKIAAGHENASTTERYIGGKESSRYDAQKYIDSILEKGD